MNILTLDKIAKEIYYLDNTYLQEVLDRYDIGIQKRVRNRGVKKEVEKMIKQLENVKVVYSPVESAEGGKLDRYLIKAGDLVITDVFSKKEAREALDNFKIKVKKLKNFIKKYCKEEV